MHGICHTRAPTSEKSRGRRLRLLDLTGLGLAAPLALGLFILAGHVAHAVAGPAAFISAIFAAAVAAIAGVSYLEFSSQFPDTRGAASFVFTYCGLGGLMASVVAWNLALDYVIGAAAAARGVRAALDELLGGVLRSTFLEIAPLDPSIASPFADFLALVLPLLAAAVLLLSPRRYAVPQVAVCVLTLCMAIFALVAGSIEADSANWSLQPENVTVTTGQGGFLPFGFPRVLSGAAIFIFAFIGVDHIAVTERKVSDDEVKGHSGWPLLVVVTCAMLSMLSLALVLTLMQPYYLLDENAALVMTFSGLDWSEARWIICVVGVLALSLTVGAGVSGSARLLRSMADDDLLWSCLGEVDLCGSTKSLFTIPAIALLTGLLGAFIEEHQLVSVLSVGTLLAFIAVQASIILHKCRDEGKHEPRGVCAVITQLVSSRGSNKSNPTATSSAAAKVALTIFCVSVTGACAVAVHAEQEVRFGRTWAVSLLATCVLLAIVSFVCLAVQPHVTTAITVPLWPLLPCLGIFSSVYLLMSLKLAAAWIRLAVCTAIGLSVFAARRWSQARQRVAGRTVSKELLTNDTSTPPHSTTPQLSAERFSIDVEQRTGTESVTSRQSFTGTHSSVTSQLHNQLGGAEEVAEPEASDITGPHTHDDEKIDLFAENGFDDQKWNKIWDYNSKDATFDPDFDSESVRDETVVAEVHESSSNVEHTDEEYQTPTLEVKKHSKHVVVVLPDGSSKETSDNDSFRSLDISQNHSPYESRSPSPVSGQQSPSVSPKHSLSPSPPRSPKPPPLPMGNIYDKPFSNNKAPAEVSYNNITAQKDWTQSKTQSENRSKTRSMPETQLPMRSLQEELKTTLRLRNQRKIDEIENTVVNVSEGIEMFGGGRRSRTASLNADVSVKSAMKAGKFEDAEFVSKLNSILKGQMGQPKNAARRPAPPAPRHKDVVFINDEVTRQHKQQMRGALEQVLSHKRDVTPSPKSLDALIPTSQIQIVSRN